MKVSIGQRIRELAEQKKIPVSEIAEKVGKTKNTFYNYVNDKTVIDVDTLQQVAEVLGVKMHDFFITNDSITNKLGIDTQNIKNELENKILSQELQINKYKTFFYELLLFIHSNISKLEAERSGIDANQLLVEIVVFIKSNIKAIDNETLSRFNTIIKKL